MQRLSALWRYSRRPNICRCTHCSLLNITRMNIVVALLLFSWSCFRSAAHTTALNEQTHANSSAQTCDVKLINMKKYTTCLSEKFFLSLLSVWVTETWSYRNTFMLSWSYLNKCVDTSIGLPFIVKENRPLRRFMSNTVWVCFTGYISSLKDYACFSSHWFVHCCYLM